LSVVKSQPLPGAREAERSSKGGVLKARSTIGRFAMAWRCVVGGVARARRRGRSAELREEERASPSRWAAWAMHAD
jgi:hypothetical protein